jgi:predicted ATP-grasp superfamily ATP-dependent carboligase
MQASPERQPLLLVSASARALAQSAARGRLPAVALDLFNDLDTRALAVASQGVAGRNGRFDSRRLIAAAQALCPPEKCAGLVYGSGLEGRTKLLARLARGRVLFGNPPQTVAMLKNPARFFSLLDSLGIPHPEVRVDPPADVSGWLVKRGGGAGGSHVRPARVRHRARADRYFQRLQAGRSLSVLFAADGQAAQVIGFNEQWTGGAWRGARYRYGGAVSRVIVQKNIEAQVAGFLARMVERVGLVGLNGLDFILAGDTPFVLEINPRPTATLELYDADAEGGMLQLHLRACRGQLPGAGINGPSRAHAIVYAADSLRIPADMTWPSWCTDLPEGRSMIAAGAPICSVHAASASSAQAQQQVLQRCARMERVLFKEAA